MLASDYSYFRSTLGGALHVMAHGHHPWPDVTREAQLLYWDDSNRLRGEKWEYIFGEIIPQVQAHIATFLNLPFRWIAFAPNTHELVARLYSCLDWRKPVRVLTTDSEFYSFDRQTRRLEETGRLQVVRIPVEPFATFNERFAEAGKDRYDFVFMSHVFYNSGFAVQGLDDLVAQLHPDSLVCIDGYHAFCAIPVDLAKLSERVFYIAGGYKYAQAGEGVCFMCVPPNAEHRPLYTGWFADPSNDTSWVQYGERALRFWGSTFDASGLYRFNATMNLFADRQITPVEIHAHARHLQELFLQGLEEIHVPDLPASALVPPAPFARGNFLTFEVQNAEEIEAHLYSHQILIDRRDNRLRFGFGLYQDENFIEALVHGVREAML